MYLGECPMRGMSHVPSEKNMYSVFVFSAAEYVMLSYHFILILVGVPDLCGSVV